MKNRDGRPKEAGATPAFALSRPDGFPPIGRQLARLPPSISDQHHCSRYNERINIGPSASLQAVPRRGVSYALKNLRVFSFSAVLGA